MGNTFSLFNGCCAAIATAAWSMVFVIMFSYFLAVGLMPTLRFVEQGIRTKGHNMKSIIDCLKSTAEDQNPAWVFPHEDQIFTASEIQERSQCLQSVLARRGVVEGARVGFMLDNSSLYTCLLYATWGQNAIAIPLRAKSGKYLNFIDYLEGCDDVCHFDLLITADDDGYHGLADWAASRKIKIASMNDVEREASLIPASTTDYIPIKPENMAIIQFSSGSTARPKGVIVTHAAMMSQLKNIQDNHQRNRDGHVVAASASWLPVNHDMGLFIGVLSPMYSGVSNILAPPGYYMKNPPRWFRLLAQYGVDFTFSTNSVLASSLASLERSENFEYSLSELHIYIAAEKVSPIIVRRAYEVLSKKGIKKEHLHIGYGMAENALGATVSPPGSIKSEWFSLEGSHQIKLGHKAAGDCFELVSIGIANDDHEITIRGINDEVLSDLVLGEINISSPCITPGYINNPTQTALAIVAEKPYGRLRTGDLGFKFEGEYYFYSRKDDLIIVGGKNIIPDDIELYAEQHKRVRIGGSVLIAVEDEGAGVIRLALLIEVSMLLPQDEQLKLSKEIKSLIFDELNIMINKVVFCQKGSIEKTSSGKKRRKIIRNRFVNNSVELISAVVKKEAVHGNVEIKV